MPSTSSSRYHANSLDILNGIALFAILLMNYQHWFVPVALPQGVTSDPSSADSITRQFTDYFISGQWYGVLAFSLGAAFYYSSQRASGPGGTSYFRRYLLLLLIGILHQFVWSGDILIIYALAGMLGVLLEKKGKNVAFMTGLLFCTNLPGFFASLFLQLLNARPAEYAAAAATEQASHVASLMTNGGVKDFLLFNIANIIPKYKQSLLTGELFSIPGFYILGYYAGRIHFMQRIKDKARFVGLAFMGFALCFLALLYLQVSLFQQGNAMTLDPIKGMVSNMAHVFGTTSYILGLLLLLHFYPLRKVLQAAAAPGSMWLSTYLFQTLAGILLFYPIGAGLYGDTGAFQNVLIATGVFLLQIIFAHVWLRYFYYGPAEWLWRSGTAGRWRRMRRGHSGSKRDG